MFFGLINISFPSLISKLNVSKSILRDFLPSGPSIFKLFPALIIKKPNNYDGIYFGIFLLTAYTLYFLYKFKLKGVIEIIKSNPSLSSTSVSIGEYFKKYI